MAAAALESETQKDEGVKAYAQALAGPHSEGFSADSLSISGNGAGAVKM